MNDERQFQDAKNKSSEVVDDTLIEFFRNSPLRDMDFERNSDLPRDVQL